MEGVVAWVFDEFDDAHFEIHELIDAEDQVLAALPMWGRGKRSGAEASWQVWNVWTFPEGKIMHGQRSQAVTKPSKPPGCRSSSRLPLRTTSGRPASRPKR
jgi:SnoaL-like domain